MTALWLMPIQELEPFKEMASKEYWVSRCFWRLIAGSALDSRQRTCATGKLVPSPVCCEEHMQGASSRMQCQYPFTKQRFSFLHDECLS